MRRKIQEKIYICILLAAILCAVTDSCALAKTTGKTVVIGYYQGDERFQAGFSDNERKTGYAYEIYQKIAGMTGWNYTYVYGTRDEVLEKLAAGEVDMVAGVPKTKLRESQMLFPQETLRMSGEENYIAVSKNHPELVEEINQAYEQLDNILPQYFPDLWNKYYNQEADENVLTDGDNEWLAKKGVLKLGYIAENMPLSDQGENGEVTGVVQEVMKELKHWLKTEIKGVCYSETGKMIEGLNKGEIDAAFPIHSDPWYVEQQGFSRTTTFITTRPMIVYQGEFSEELTKKIAIRESYIGQSHFISTLYPDSDIRTFKKEEESFEALQQGEVGCVIDNSGIIQRFMNQNAINYPGFNVAYMEYSEDYSICVKKENAHLLRILNKAVAHIDSTDITTAMIQYSGIEEDNSLRRFLRLHYIGTVMFFVILLVGVLCFFSVYRSKTEKFNKEQQKMQKALWSALNNANAANRAKTTFLSNMSHDIRTPMNGIIGMTAIASANLDNPSRVEDCLKKITVSSNHLLSLINDVLDLSKIESGEMSLNEDLFSLRELMEDMVVINRPQALAKNHQFQVVIGDLAHERVLGDKLHLQQVFTNLVSNALKYTPEGGKIKVTLQENQIGEKPRGCYEFIVEDNGIGMSEDFITHIFEMYAQEDNPNSDMEQRTGLGMAIANNIVTMMDGTIDVESKLGEGSTFTATFYLRLPENEEKKEAEESKKTETVVTAEAAAHTLSDVTKQADFSGIHMILAEDNELNAEIAMEILKMIGVEATWVKNGQEAVTLMETADEGVFDGIFMDLQMPVMGGIEAAQKIRKLPDDKGRDIPIFAMTANAFSDDVHAVLEAGMNKHIAKPLDVEALIRILREYYPNADKDNGTKK